MIMRRARLAFFPLALAACDSGRSQVPASSNAQVGDVVAPGDFGDRMPYSGIAPDDTISFTGTEPFWSGEVSGRTLTYSTPDDIDGSTILVERFSGRNGLSLAGELRGAPFDMAITPGKCSDGMSDRTYPFTVTLEVGGHQRRGCAWTDSKPFSGPEHP